MSNRLLICFRFVVILLLLSASYASAQRVGIGVKAGLRLTDDLSGDATPESKRYVVGPMVTVGLPFGFTAEADALYRRVAYRTSGSDILGDSFALRGTANSWEFPILVRHRLIGGLFGGLYGGIGYAPRVIHGSSRMNSILVVNPFTMPGVKVFSTSTQQDRYATTQGLVVSGGFEKRLGPVRLSPEIRYTHWSKPALAFYGSHGFEYQSSQEQADLLVGISFP